MAGDDMNTKQLSAQTGVPMATIRRFAEHLGAIPVGGNVGFVFSAKAPTQLRLLIQDAASQRKKAGRKSWKKERQTAFEPR